MKVYVMRHGLTDWNLNNKIQGQKDTELNEIGIQQAKDAREKFNSYNFDLIICSPLKRAKSTAKIINQNKNVETYEESSYNQELKQNITDFLNDDETV